MRLTSRVRIARGRGRRWRRWCCGLRVLGSVGWARGAGSVFPTPELSLSVSQAFPLPGPSFRNHRAGRRGCRLGSSTKERNVCPGLFILVLEKFFPPWTLSKVIAEAPWLRALRANAAWRPRSRASLSISFRL